MKVGFGLPRFGRGRSRFSRSRTPKATTRKRAGKPGSTADKAGYMPRGRAKTKRTGTDGEGTCEAIRGRQVQEGEK